MDTAVHGLAHVASSTRNATLIQRQNNEDVWGGDIN